MQARSGDLISDGPSSRLSELGIVLPAPPAPLGAYVESSDTGNLLFLSGTLPVVNGKLAIAGRLGQTFQSRKARKPRASRRSTPLQPPNNILAAWIGLRSW